MNASTKARQKVSGHVEKINLKKIDAIELTILCTAGWQHMLGKIC